MAPSGLLLILLVSVTLAEDDWTKQCDRCKCIWANGKKSADCTSSNFDEIPKNLSPEIREIDFSNNRLGEFRANEFNKANLRDIHKMKFQNCSIQTFDDRAFNGLVLLIELDLSRNELTELRSNIFKENARLRVISFSNNRIKTVSDGLFYNMTFLQKVNLDHNEIEHLNNNSFKFLKALNHIGLEGNRLTTLSLDFDSLPKLSSLTIADNPWNCNCKLESFKMRVLQNNLNTAPVYCNEPKLYKSQVWSKELIFACVPRIVEPITNSVVKVEESNVTLSCKVTGNPGPDVDWMTNNRIIDRDPRQSKQKYVINKNNVGDFWYNNLTIINFSYRDRGDYKCLAKNPGGDYEVNITLTYPPHMISGSAPIGVNLGLIIGLSVVICVTLIIIIVTLVCFCKRNRNNGAMQKRNDDSDGAEEFIGLRNQPELKKQQLTDVNPVLKPPRVTIPPGSVTSGGTEVSDHRRILQDNDSCFDMDECSMDGSTMPLMRKSHMILDDFRPYPPDLLPFPPRALQPSPAGSSASTVADTTRLPPHHGPQSPLHSPMYESLYRTLPISRSQSPFITPVPPRIPRLGQGYVTIPRRPRQSWSSEPPLSDIGEPLYDNLGKRTSINGSSALSLNKLGDTSTPKSNRLMSPSPTIGPIAEHDSPPIAVHTLPRNLNRLSPSRTNWAKANAEALRSPEKRKSTASLPGAEPKKIPPRPPPKPKKQPTATRPLFEDEGEDGTEV